MTSRTDAPLRMAMLISGGGRTMLNIADRIDAGKLNATIELVIASRPDAAGIERAKQRGLHVELVARKQFADVQAFSDAIWSLVRPHHIDLVCLAGFLSLLRIPDDFAGRVMNIHPALLPQYGGKGMYGHHVHEAVVANHETETGCTVHLCDNIYDHGPVLVQRRCPVLPTDTPDDVAARVFEQECLAYPEAIQKFIDRRRS
ncbi:MAG: phosphoribosylglycinamide formyltransferase [Planctomycetes bacterium]|nr:phosphoribosylglycinamide formyltransferase [Planctomycetota bacterium]